MVNLKMSITKLTRVSFGTPKVLYTTKMCVTINHIMKTPTQLQMIGLFPILVHIETLYFLLF